MAQNRIENRRVAGPQGTAQVDSDHSVNWAGNSRAKSCCPKAAGHPLLYLHFIEYEHKGDLQANAATSLHSEDYVM
jgi:hypothetical protein